jgi:hypothetical protein
LPPLYFISFDHWASSGGDGSYNGLFQVDPCPGVKKQLHIVYEYKKPGYASQSPLQKRRSLQSSSPPSPNVHEVDTFEDEELLISTVPDDTRWADEAFQVKAVRYICV